MENSALRYVKKVSDNPEMSHSKLLARIKPKSTVLEFGPASGAMTKVLSQELQCKVSIVELDQECFEKTIQYAEDGVCTNIESDSWIKYFEGKKYDYIIFADVLEHLFDAERAVGEAKNFLTEDGSILVSVPNIAHNSIIIQLLKNHFIYQSTGLLDYTHVRHFTFNELQQLFDQSGMKAIYIDATYVGVGKNEFDVSYDDVPNDIADLLRHRPLGEVYQYIMEFKDKAYYDCNSLKVMNCLGEKKDFVNIYVDSIPNRINDDFIAKLCMNPNELFVSNDEIARLRLEINEFYINHPQYHDMLVAEKRIDSLESELRKVIQDKEILKKERDDVEKQLFQNIQERERIEKQFLEKEHELEHIKNEKTYKFALKIKGIIVFFLPANSRRRFIVRVIYNAVKNPRLMFHVINPKRIAHFFKYLKLEGMEGVQRRYKEAVDLEKRSSCTNQLLELSKVKEKPRKLKDYDKLALIRQDAPLVSIIIPVYNEFYYTYECVKSIVKQSGNISYEIIIANDKSTDITRDIEKVFENIRLVTTKENVRFLLNCNNAAKFAKGKYILFLNNDTQVQKNWLAPLVNLMESDASIGMVGSKLVFPDGRLQEAGGIIWKDASAWNYGRGENPEQPEYNYVKEVDYISGAAIMIKTDLWNEIGGFDEIFAPAYCEDSDLAFEVRKRGYKVMYQPLSVVVHFEGVSNGTDTSVGLKSYQVENQQKLLTKWNEVLSEEHFPNAENVFCARDRSVNKPVVVMVDHYVPQYDKDAGSRTVFQYLSLFVKQGYNVKFIGDNFYRDEPYTTALQQMGIEVLYGSYYSENWKQWIKDNSNNIDFVFLNRPHISVKYIDFIRKETNAKIIYYGHDLHFLREYRNYELTKDAEILELSEKWKTNEFELMKKADVVYYPSNIEIEEIKKIDSSLNAKAIVAYMFENVSDVDYSYEQRKDLMFIGGFGHTPNIDGVLWFSKEVFPIIKEEIPDIVFHILGSKPTDEIKALENDNIEVRGFVSDEELADYYAKCKISVVPLRYGAGIKGKVVEALKFGIPVVTTSTGAEGIVDADDILCVEDEPIKLAKRIIELYKNEDELKTMSKKSTNYIRTYFSEAKAWDVIKEDFK